MLSCQANSLLRMMMAETTGTWLDISFLFVYVWSWSMAPENPSLPLAGNLKDC